MRFLSLAMTLQIMLGAWMPASASCPVCLQKGHAHQSASTKKHDCCSENIPTTPAPSCHNTGASQKQAPHQPGCCMMDLLCVEDASDQVASEIVESHGFHPVATLLCITSAYELLQRASMHHALLPRGGPLTKTAAAPLFVPMRI